MKKFENTTTRYIHNSQESTYDDNKDIIWPTVVGIFVALALGWMICRYKCSSKERSPHIVQCCPKSLCKRIRLCCMCIFRLNKEPRQYSRPDGQMLRNKGRPSNNSILEIPFIVNNSTNNRLSLTQPSQQWPPSFLVNSTQGPSLPLSIAIQPSAITSSQPKRHPLRRESTLLGLEHNSERRGSSPWPFLTSNMVFHKQTNEIKKKHLFFN